MPSGSDLRAERRGAPGRAEVDDRRRAVDAAAVKRAERALGEVRVVAERGRLEVEVPVLGLAIAEVRDVGEH